MEALTSRASHRRGRGVLGTETIPAGAFQWQGMREMTDEHPLPMLYMDIRQMQDPMSAIWLHCAGAGSREQATTLYKRMQIDSGG